ncbi:hypothetical protein ACTA71_000906 [Dictyostelium dimigraforme]
MPCSILFLTNATRSTHAQNCKSSTSKELYIIQCINPCPCSVSISDSLSTGANNLLSAMEIAEQCTLADYDLFNNVRLSDCLSTTGPSTTTSQSTIGPSSTHLDINLKD